MPAVGRYLFILTLLSFLGVTGCGGNGSVAVPGTGPFSNSSLNGTFAFSISGLNNAFGFFAFAGSLQMDGKGNIVSGTQDFTSAAGIFTNVSVSGTYAVRANGQGTATLNSSIATVNLDFVVISPQRALVSRFDNNATASGSLDLASSSSFSASALPGPFTFSLSGIDGSGNNLQTAGNFTISAGAVSGGIADFNDSSGSVTMASAIGSGGGFTVASNGRGTLTFSGTPFGNLNFVFYVVDSTHLKMIEIDNAPFLAGDAFLQQGTSSNASLSGHAAFTVAGSFNGNPFVAGGTFTADGSGNVTSGSEDLNTSTTVTQNVALSGTYSIANNGRGTMILNTSSGTFNFAIYPSTGGLQMQEIDSNILSGGIAFSQQGGSFSNATFQGTYGMNFTAANGAGGEADAIAQLNADGNGRLNGAIDLNNQGAATFNLALSGNYSVSTNGRAPATLQSSSTQHIVVYLVSNSRALFIGIDPAQPLVGTFEHQ